MIGEGRAVRWTGGCLVGVWLALTVAPACASAGAAVREEPAAALPGTDPVDDLIASERVLIEYRLRGERWRIVHRGLEIADDELLELAGQAARAAQVRDARAMAARTWWQAGWACALAGGYLASQSTEGSTGLIGAGIGALLLWQAWRTERAYGRAPHHAITLPEAYRAAQNYNESLQDRF